MNIDCVKDLLLTISALSEEKLKQNDSFPLITADQICNKLSDKEYTFAEIARYIDELNSEGLINAQIVNSDGRPVGFVVSKLTKEGKAHLQNLCQPEFYQKLKRWIKEHDVSVSVSLGDILKISAKL